MLASNAYWDCKIIFLLRSLCFTSNSGWYHLRVFSFLLFVLQTVFLLMFGNFVCNYFCIFYWYYEPNPNNQTFYGRYTNSWSTFFRNLLEFSDLILMTNSITGLPLSGMGTFYGLTFNWLCMMSLLAHLRAAWADPGVIQSQKVSSIFVDNYTSPPNFNLSRSHLDTWTRPE